MIRRPLLWALILSVLVHACWVVDVELAWPWQKQAADEVLASKQAEAVKRVRLAAKPKANTARREILQLTLLKPAAPTPAPTSSSPPVKAPPLPEAKEPSATPNEAPLIAENTVEPSLPIAPEPEPEMTFPLSVLAKQRAHYYGFTMDLSQQWLMEGTRYVIRNEASKFGFKAEILSEGLVSPEGLQPEHYQLSLNNTLRNYADFNRSQNQLLHGKAGTQNIAELTSDMQDMASLPFHVAVTYEGRAERKLMVTTGSSVYEITLQVIAEETLKLPGGIVRTIHLQGNRTRTDGKRQDGYNIWLAPDFRNFPVRFSGPDSKGNLLEMSVSSLAFDGRLVFGRDLPALPEENRLEGIPEGIKVEHLQDLPSPNAEPMPASGLAPSSGSMQDPQPSPSAPPVLDTPFTGSP